MMNSQESSLNNISPETQKDNRKISPLDFFEKDKLKVMQEKKRKTERAAFLYKSIGDERKADRLLKCGKYRLYEKYADGSMRLTKTYFCELRMCPQCMWLLARKRAVDLFKILAEPEHKDKRYIFITLTVRNCKADELSETLDKMYKGLRSWTSSERAFLNYRILGIVQKLEITYNKKANTFHPHFHLLCEVENSYFKDESKYIEAPDLSKKWAETLGLDYHPSCKIQAVKKHDTKSVLETAKYTAKDSDYLINADIFKVFESALKHRRLYEVKGSFKVTMQRLKLDPDSFEDINNKIADVVNNNPCVLRFALIWQTGIKRYTVRIEKSSAELEELAGKALITGTME